MAAAVRRKAIRPPLRKSATLNSTSSASASRGILPPTSTAIAARDSKASAAAAAEADPLMAASFLPFWYVSSDSSVLPPFSLL
ncbi:hypothetical protein ABW20_dc0101428 [Dactylellina cionopaga]|nr:hypothetical protein ABW20_dc0101428 [Dactylellina cionopaga]